MSYQYSLLVLALAIALLSNKHGTVYAIDEQCIHVARVNVEYGANIREGPGTTYRIAGIARHDEEINLVGMARTTDIWYQLDSGYWMVDYVLEIIAAPCSLPLLPVISYLPFVFNL